MTISTILRESNKWIDQLNRNIISDINIHLGITFQDNNSSQYEGNVFAAYYLFVLILAPAPSYGGHQENLPSFLAGNE